MEIGIATEDLPQADTISEIVEEVGGALHAADAGDLAHVDLVLASGWEDVATLVNHDVDSPLLVIDSPAALAAIERTDLRGTLADWRDDRTTRLRHRTMRIATGEHTVSGFAQAVLVTEEPATISEFALSCDGHEICQYRADGFTIATPAGSSGYARAAGGPVLQPSVDGFAVVPIAPYRSDPNHWVLDGRIELAILRGTDDVGLFVDGRPVATVDPEAEIVIEGGVTYETIVSQNARSPYDG